MPRIVLKSNDSLNYFPNNKPSDFTIKTVNLSSIGHNLEVALSEIIFPQRFYNVRDGYNSIDIVQTSRSEVSTSRSEVSTSRSEVSTSYSGISKGSGQPSDEEYDAIPDVGVGVAAIRSVRFAAIRSEDPKIPITYSIDPFFYTPTMLIDEINKKTNAVFFKLKLEEKSGESYLERYKDVNIRFGIDIAKILGFEEWCTGPNESDGIRANAYKNMSLLNIYCNIVEESLIGENHHQLLRIVNWNSAKKDNQTSPSIVYNYPYFIPVTHTNLNCIEIKITDSMNIPVEFIDDDEPVIIILEFRKAE